MWACAVNVPSNETRLANAPHASPTFHCKLTLELLILVRMDLVLISAYCDIRFVSLNSRNLLDDRTVFQNIGRSAASVPAVQLQETERTRSTRCLPSPDIATLRPRSF